MTNYRTALARAFAVLSLSAVISGVSSAWAATGTLDVKAQVANSCTIGNATLDFRTYSPAAGAAAATTVDVNCTLLAPYTLSMDSGQNASGGSNRMKATVSGEARYIPYAALFATSVTATSGVAILSGIGTGAAVATPIIGTAASGANVPAGNYSDSVIMTVSF